MVLSAIRADQGGELRRAAAAIAVSAAAFRRREISPIIQLATSFGWPLAVAAISK